MLEMLKELTKGTWFSGMENFSEYVYNAEEIKAHINMENCIEFGTYNGQELLIYADDGDGKRVRYSCTMTAMYGKVVLENAYDKTGKVYQADVDAIEEQIRQDKSIVIPYTIKYIKENCIQHELDVLENYPNDNTVTDLYKISEIYGKVCAYSEVLDMLLISEDRPICSEFDSRIGKLYEKIYEVLRKARAEI